jgi:D-tyrosyl-tRNA(Tyr) deacylase
MRAIIQRATSGRVMIAGAAVATLDPAPGVVVLLGVGPGDGEAEARLLADKVAGLRIFADGAGKINRSLLDVGGGALVVSQFTLYADVRRGRRPGFTTAAPPEVAAPLVERFAAELRALGVPVQGGRFGADMAVELVNDGPFTLVLDSDLWAGGGRGAEGPAHGGASDRGIEVPAHRTTESGLAAGRPPDAPTGPAHGGEP